MHASEFATRRRKLGMTQEELAKELDVTPTTIARWERGEATIGHPRMVRLALQRLDDELVANPSPDRTKRAHDAMLEELQDEEARHE